METFIRHYDLADNKYCEQAIRFHKERSHLTAGLCGGDGLVRTDAKKSLDSTHSMNDLPKCLIVLMNNVQTALDLYLKEFPDADRVVRFGFTDTFNIQHYKPNWSYSARHCERASKETSYRHLVFMVYLNTVTDGGGTHFPNQEVTLEPLAGRIVIWPSDWTHHHYGIVSPTQDKYILTGWFSYV